MDEQEIFRRTTANRRLAADMLAGLSAEQWQTMSLCDGWTIQVLAGHMLMPVSVSFPKTLLRLIPARGNFAKVVDDVSREFGRRRPEQIVQEIRDRAGVHAKPPFVGATGPMVDSCVHLRDAARPLGLDTDVSLDDWAFVLRFLVSAKASLGFVPKGRLDGLALRATDQGFNHGTGAELSGRSEALAMALAGRTAALDDLIGGGVSVLAQRISAAA